MEPVFSLWVESVAQAAKAIATTALRKRDANLERGIGVSMKMGGWGKAMKLTSLIGP
jgi:hypothetical protein